MGLLDSILGGTSGQAAPQRGMSPITLALMGLLAYRTFQGKGRLAEMLGRTGEPGAVAGDAAPSIASAGGLENLVGGLFGGGGGAGLISGGLSDLLSHFQQNGHGDAAQSWVGSGPNKPLSAEQLEQAIGSERMAWLMQHTGMSREDLLDGLRKALPDFVDKLTPEGRIPTEQEAARMI